MPCDLFGDMAEASIGFLRKCAPTIGKFSGGKDSVVVKHIAERAGIDIPWVYNVTTVDPPELVRFIKSRHPDVRCHIPKRSMYRLIVEKGLPTVRHRFCCHFLKEASLEGGPHRIVTGIRADESVARRSRGPLEQSRKFPDQVLIHPILGWTSADVWAYIRHHDLAYCSLYNEGFKRLGCIMCPYDRGIRRAMARWPSIFRMARNALQRRWDEGRVNEAARARYSDAEAMWQWWLSFVEKSTPQPQRTCGGLFV